jgi:hypothetical protein
MLLFSTLGLTLAPGVFEATLGQVFEASCQHRNDKDRYGMSLPGHRARGLASLAPLAASVALSNVQSMWTRNLRHLAMHTRAELLSDVAALLPFVTAMGDAEYVRELRNTAARVCAWWP